MIMVIGLIELISQNKITSIMLACRRQKKIKKIRLLIKKVLVGHQGRDHVHAKQIHFSSEMFKSMLAIRMSSPLFRLTSEQAIMDKMSFLNIDGNRTMHYQVHPMQLSGTDEVIKQSKVTEKAFTVPALSSVIFVKEVN